MSASEDRRAEWLEPEFWERLHRLEVRHRQLKSQQEIARRSLERARPSAGEELRDAWRSYCEVIAQLDQTTAEFEALRTCQA
jgi:hypothetical protein